MFLAKIHSINSCHATGFQLVQAISEQQCLFFFILNYYNLGSSCCTQNYNGQHLISTMFLCSSIYNLLHYHKNLKLSYPLVTLKASLESGPTYYWSLFISHGYLTYSLGCVSAVPIHTSFSLLTLTLHI